MNCVQHLSYAGENRKIQASARKGGSRCNGLSRPRTQGFK